MVSTQTFVHHSAAFLAGTYCPPVAICHNQLSLVGGSSASTGATVFVAPPAPREETVFQARRLLNFGTDSLRRMRRTPHRVLPALTGSVFVATSVLDLELEAA